MNRLFLQNCFFVAIVFGPCFAGLCDEPSQANDSANPEGIEFFESKIRPLLHARCVECHSDAEPESGLSLESKEGLLRGGKLGAAVTPGKPKESLLISAVNHDEFLKMPPKDKLSTGDLALLTKWVAMGAPWPAASSDKQPPGKQPDNNNESAPFQFTPEQKSFWAYQPLQRPALPEMVDSRFHSPIDRFIHQKLQAKGLTQSSPASKRDLIRRATYDLTGLPPSDEEIEQFVADSSPNAFANLIDRLLASPRYGEKWGRHWLDVARFADSNGLDENIAYANAYRYRDYVVDSLNCDKPYDRFVQEQIAGDLLPPVDEKFAARANPLDRFIATGFLSIGAKMLAEDDPTKMQMDIIDEQLSTLCQAFMGMTIGCARCHDHKFDPLPTADYYSLAGIFKSTQTMENHNVVARWFERPLATDSELEVVRALDKQLAAVKEASSKLNQSTQQRVADEIRKSAGNALLATAQANDFSRRSSDRLQRGLNQATDAYAVNAGYALIEAEGFHRGDVIRDMDNYGKDIGVIITSGGAHAEYDLNVEHAGRYAIELRYAAADRRPIRILLDGKEIQRAAASEITGSWQPDSQAWFVSATTELSAGRHVLRFESKRVFPHIDKFAVVYQANESWPFGTEPLALSRSTSDLGISYPVLALWQTYLRQKPKEDSAGPAFFSLWSRFSAIESDFEAESKKLLEQLATETPLRQSTHAVLRDTILAANPTSLKQVASAYQQAIDKVIATDVAGNAEQKKLREEVLGDGSPLAGPKNDIERFYSVDEKLAADELMAKQAEIEKQRPNLPMAMGVTESKPEDLRIHMRGSHVVLGKLVSRRFPQVLTGSDQPTIVPSSSGRLEFAEWMTRPDHPLTSRVIANRVWHWHFGRGIVPSVDNFGMLGQKPTHPELLDWLACELVENEWSLKHLHRTIMLSQTYQTSTRFQEAGYAADPENELLWRFRRRRLTGEETRDSIISVGTGVDQTMYGTLMNVANHAYVNSTGGAGTLNYSNARRSVYLPVIRSGVFDVLQTLDFPDPSMLSGERQTSTVAPQALLMMNSDLVHEQSSAIAEQLLKLPIDEAQRIEAVYLRILKRQPTTDEMTAASNFIRTSGLSAESSAATAWQSLCRVLISSNEFSYIE
ncbi:MAG: DUF1553 domain-containing protein [Pirellulaceae bacterium]|nr:DUF1553 domain-containing protein [Pirellulaceae bacterium]